NRMGAFMQYRTLASGLGFFALWLSSACATDPGDPGTGTDSAHPALLDRSTPIPPGGVCPAGGTSVQAGADVNGNGVLDDEEVERTTTVCGAVTPPPPLSDIFVGDFTADDWNDADKVAALGSARIIVGALTVAPAAAAVLPRLET